MFFVNVHQLMGACTAHGFDLVGEHVAEGQLNEEIIGHDRGTTLWRGVPLFDEFAWCVHVL